MSYELVKIIIVLLVCLGTCLATLQISRMIGGAGGKK